MGRLQAVDAVLTVRVHCEHGKDRAACSGAGACFKSAAGCRCRVLIAAAAHEGLGVGQGENRVQISVRFIDESGCAQDVHWSSVTGSWWRGGRRASGARQHKR
jgi:hypothetical protein